MYRRCLCCLLLTLAAVPRLFAGSATNDELRQLAKQALSQSPQTADKAVAELREVGLQSLEFLLNARRQLLLRKSELPNTDRLDTLIDRVAGQRYGHLSGLFWHTDLAQALAASHQTGKPILSLRMLGNLTDEYSCANSRFFRTTLYCNAQIAKTLGEHFVLHWQSVRPVPRVTIDFGDGRKLERTLTGNSAHYILDADGTPLDVLPGLYGPEQFSRWLADMRDLHKRALAAGPDKREQVVRQYHAERIAALSTAWQQDLAALPSLGNRLPGDLNDRQWQQVAQLPIHAVALDPASKAVIRRENPGAARGGKPRHDQAARVEDPLLVLVSTLQGTIGLDSIRNEYMLHWQAHHWFEQEPALMNVVALNERVYAELFLTPSSDPWLGLADDATYTALQNAGVVTTQTGSR